jgi:hypothetical protein
LSAAGAIIRSVGERSSIGPYAAFALPHYSDRDSAHDEAHIKRILARLDDLSAGVEPAPRSDRLNFLACFHGLALRVRDDLQFREEAEALLGSLGWPPAEIAEAFVALDRHCDDPRTPEEWIVHDANYIELLGVFGVAKAFTKGGAEHQSYEETLDIFERNLDRIEFRTPHGRALAEEGRSCARAFIARLRDEL